MASQAWFPRKETDTSSPAFHTMKILCWKWMGKKHCCSAQTRHFSAQKSHQASTKLFLCTMRPDGRLAVGAACWHSSLWSVKKRNSKTAANGQERAKCCKNSGNIISSECKNSCSDTWWNGAYLYSRRKNWQRLTSKASAGKQNFCPAEAFLLTLKQILPDSQKSANYPYRVKEMQNLSAVTKTGWSFYGNRAGNHCAFCTWVVK